MTETATPAPASPEFPYGVGRSEDADAPIAYTTYDAACALALLQRIEDGDEPQDIITLSDEQIVGVDGHLRRQLTALPWLELHEQDRAVAATAGLRSLLASGQVALGQDLDTGERRWLVDPAINGCSVLRRTADVLCSAERQVQGEAGPQTHRLYYYVHREGILEEEVTASGMHVFRVLRPEAVPARMITLVDQDAAAGESGEPTLLEEGDLAPGGRFAQRLADARAITILSALDTRTDDVKQLTVYATTTEVLAQQAEDLESETPRLTLKPVSREELTDLAAWFVRRDEEA
ncbi:hypothetical protein [Brachybacterium phenoliresistens]|uniref:hypothetical protein n=1 Tax=Brachybacterium phenoliresistens TaxID=396014 RepID=UPI0031D1E48F